MFLMSQYDSVSKDYSLMHSSDSVKVYAQYPSVINLLGDVKDKLLLDVGCGDGVLARSLAKKGAFVVGYDISSSQISLAKELSADFPQIKYFVSSPKDFSFPKKFDSAFAAMVLCYLNDLVELQSLFDSIFSSLKVNGFFVLLDLEKNLLPFGKDYFSRRFDLLPNGKISLNFHVPNTKPFSVKLTGFTKKDFEFCAKKSGFKSVKWFPVNFTNEGKKVVGEKFLREYAKDGFWISGVFQK